MGGAKGGSVDRGHSFAWNENFTKDEKEKQLKASLGRDTHVPMLARPQTKIPVRPTNPDMSTLYTATASSPTTPLLIHSTRNHIAN